MTEGVHLAVVKLQAMYGNPYFHANLGAVVGFVVVVVVAELCAGRAVTRYLGRSVRTDMLYTIFYVGGVYAVLVGSPLARLLRALVEGWVPFLDAALLRGLPAPVHGVLALLVFDCARYWLHRWTHASPTLWAFHRIHHSQEMLTPLTNYRFHAIDMALHSLAMLVVYLVLGTPTVAWLVVGLAITWLHLLAHTGYRWGFGPLDWLLVSPRYHALHHSVDASDAGRNFGFTLSVWDWLFGTMNRSGVANAFGVPAPGPPESFFRQIPEPFFAVARTWRRASVGGSK